MFEDMLAYKSMVHLAESFSELLAADLENDARLFYGRMAFDIAIVAGVERPSDRASAERALLIALAATGPNGTAAWRELYREVATVVAGGSAGTVLEELDGAVGAARGRLRQFLCENVDVADALAVKELERVRLRRAVGA